MSAATGKSPTSQPRFSTTSSSSRSQPKRSSGVALEATKFQTTVNNPSVNTSGSHAVNSSSPITVASAGVTGFNQSSIIIHTGVEKGRSPHAGLECKTLSGAGPRKEQIPADGLMQDLRTKLSTVSNCSNHSEVKNNVLSANDFTNVDELTIPTRMTSTPLKTSTRNADAISEIDDITSECNAKLIDSNDTDAEYIVTHRKSDATKEHDVDIDGLPLSGRRKKLNLKLLLQSSTEDYDDDGITHNSILDDEISKASLSDEECHQEHQQQKEDTSEEGFHLDDYEFPDEDDDRDRQERRLFRKSSLRSVKSDCSQDSITSPTGEVPSSCKKFVTFADNLGMGLADIRALLNPDEPPLIPCSALRDLNMRRRRTRTEGLFTLWLDFEPPSARSDFVLRLLDQKVVLENCMVTDADLSVCGVVRVYNIAFDKRVFIRYTVNNWHTEHDVLATYVPESSDGTSDRFMFNVRLPDGFGLVEARQGRSGRIEFALCYCAGSDTYWDNNNGANYVIFCRLLNNMEPL